LVHQYSILVKALEKVVDHVLELDRDAIVFLVVILGSILVKEIKDSPELAVILALTFSSGVPGVGVHPHTSTWLSHDFSGRKLNVFFTGGVFGHFWEELEFVVPDSGIDGSIWVSGNWVESLLDERVDSGFTADLFSTDEKRFGLEDTALERVVLDPLVAPWHEWVFSHNFFVVFIAASETEETVLTSGLGKRRVVGAVFDHFDVISASPPFIVKGRDVEVVGVALAFSTTELVGDNWFKELRIVKVKGQRAVRDGSFFVTLRDTVLAWVASGVAVPAGAHDGTAVEFGDTGEANILPEVDKFGEFLGGHVGRDLPDVVGAAERFVLKFKIVDSGVVHEWVEVKSVPEEPGAVLGSFKLIGFLDPEFVLVVEDKEDVVVAPWDLFDFVLGHLGSTKVWVIAAVRVDFALVSGDVSAKVLATWLPLSGFNKSTSVKIHHFEVDKVKFLTWVSTGGQFWNIWLSNSSKAGWVDLSSGGHDEHFLHFVFRGVTLAGKKERSGHWVDVAVFDHRVDVKLFSVFNSKHKRHGFDRHLAALSHPLDKSEFLIGSLLTAVSEDGHNVRRNSHLLVKLEFNELAGVSGLSVLHPLVFRSEVGEKLFLEEIFDVDGSLGWRFWELLLDNRVHLHHHQVGDRVDAAFDFVVSSTLAVGAGTVGSFAGVVVKHHKHKVGVLVISSKLVAVKQHDVKQHFAVVVFTDTLVSALGNAVFIVVAIKKQKREHSIHVSAAADLGLLHKDHHQQLIRDRFLAVVKNKWEPLLHIAVGAGS